MKQTAKLLALRSFFFACFLSLFTMVTWAQENTEGGGGETTTTTTKTSKTTDINITSDTGDTWYTQPWVWIVGAAVFILLLVALLNTGKSRDTVSTSDRVTVKKTVERDTGSDL